MRTTILLPAVVLALAGLGASVTVASAADLFRHRRHNSRASADVYTEDYGCRQQEPSVYRPRTLNYGEPLCYAAQPYGISTHLYDHSRELSEYNSAAGY